MAVIKTAAWLVSIITTQTSNFTVQHVMIGSSDQSYIQMLKREVLRGSQRNFVLGYYTGYSGCLFLGKRRETI